MVQHEDEAVQRAAATLERALRGVQDARREVQLGHLPLRALMRAVWVYVTAAASLEDARAANIQVRLPRLPVASPTEGLDALSLATSVVPSPPASPSVMRRPPLDVPRVFVDAFEHEIPLPPTARLRFAKWLVTTGRLSDDR